jgi:hypothetical protein
MSREINIHNWTFEKYNSRQEQEVRRQEKEDTRGIG